MEARRIGRINYFKTVGTTAVTDTSVFVASGNSVDEYDIVTRKRQKTHHLPGPVYEMVQSDNTVFASTHNLDTNERTIGTISVQRKVSDNLFFSYSDCGRVTVCGYPDIQRTIDDQGNIQSYTNRILLSGSRTISRLPDRCEYRFNDPPYEALITADITCVRNIVFYRQDDNVVVYDSALKREILRCLWPWSRGLDNRVFESLGSFIHVSFGKAIRVVQIVPASSLLKHLQCLPNVLSGIVSEYACGVREVCVLPGSCLSKHPRAYVHRNTLWLCWVNVVGRTIAIDLSAGTIAYDEPASLSIEGFDPSGIPICPYIFLKKVS